MKLNAQIMAALRTFEVAARCGSFTQAARELHISAGAISQQMANLESQLNLILFVRHSRGIKLSNEGRSLFAVVEPSLNSIVKVIANLQVNNNQEQEIRIKSTPSFAYKWLVPRLHDFYHKHPLIRVQIFADGALVDTEKTDYDLAIDFSPIPYPKNAAVDAQLLMTESLIPVVSPDYAKAHNWQDKTCWDDVTLLHDAMPWLGASNDCEWRFWFDAMGLVQQNSQCGHSFNRTDLAMEAALAGQGIALARKALLTDNLEKGTLVAPFAAISADSGYFVLNAAGAASSKSIETFKHWLNDQAMQWQNEAAT